MPAAPARSLVHDEALGGALDLWGRFTGPDGRGAAAGAWVPAGGELIRGRLDRIRLDLLTIDARRFAVARTARHVARTAGTRHIVVVQLAGSSVLTPADGRPPVRLEPGDVSYGDPTTCYRWEFSGAPTLLMLRTPLAALPLAPASLRPILGSPFAADEGHARLAVGFAREVLADPALLSGSSGPRAVQDAVGLFASMLADRLARAAPEDPTQPAFERAVDHIARHLAEPLTVAGIARENGMSPRYLQTIFARRGLSVSGWIRGRRLESARLALLDPAWAGIDIAQVAFAHGFADHSHFTRCFRAAFGETPSRWRGRAGS